MRHSEPHAIVSPARSLASELRKAERRLAYAKYQLEELLDIIYGPGDWHDIEIGYDGTLDVYGVTPCEKAIETLQRVGFQNIWQHPHELHEFRQCSCRSLAADHH